MPTSATGHPEPGTRARRRARVRAEAEQIALDMFAAHGFEAVTMGDIAAALDVSERTLFRYFDSKESLLDPRHEEIVARLVTVLAERPSDESAFTAVHNTLRVLSEEFDEDRDAMALRTAIIGGCPALQSHLLHRQTELEDAIGAVVAERAGVDAADLRPRVFAAATVGALRVAIETWLSGDPQDDLLDHTNTALDLLANGLADL